MIAVIFEVWTKPELHAEYLARAACLRAELASVPGFISVERFESLSEPGKILSLSFFTDESAVADWRQRSAHRAAQSAGRGTSETPAIFEDYRLRVAEVQRDYGLRDRDQAPQDSRASHPA
jgi:heme-degrading monooxygenase HmoA